MRIFSIQRGDESRGYAQVPDMRIFSIQRGDESRGYAHAQSCKHMFGDVMITVRVIRRRVDARMLTS